MAYHLEKTAQNRSVAPLRRAAIESDYGPSGKEFYRGLVFGRYLLFRTCFRPHVACNLIHVWAHLPDFYKESEVKRKEGKEKEKDR